MGQLENVSAHVKLELTYNITVNVIYKKSIYYNLGGLLHTSIDDAEHNSTYTKLGFLEIHVVLIHRYTLREEKCVSVWASVEGRGMDTTVCSS